MTQKLLKKGLGIGNPIKAIKFDSKEVADLKFDVKKQFYSK